MIYVDSSVALAHLLSETRRPPDTFWSADLVTSELLSYEAWTRLHALGLGDSHGDALRRLLGHTLVLQMTPLVLARALEPFPTPVRTLDAIHLASLVYLQSTEHDISLASYDIRMATAARALGIEVVEP